MNTNEALEPCPFCGSEKLHRYMNAFSSDMQPTEHVACLSCGCGQSSVKAWNTRAALALPPLPEQRVIDDIINASRQADEGPSDLVRRCFRAALAQPAAGEPVAWAQLGMRNGHTYVRMYYEGHMYPPPPDVQRNLNLVPLYAAPQPAHAPAFADPEGLPWLLHMDTAARIANGHRVRVGTVQAIAKEVQALHDTIARPAPARMPLQWQAPGPVASGHPLQCLIVIESLRQSDGDWWIKGSTFLADGAPLAWVEDNESNRAALGHTGASEEAP